MQIIVLSGGVGQDPQMRYTPSGVPVTNVSLATNEVISKEYKPECPKGWEESYNGKNWELVTWWRLTAWRGMAEVINQYVSKGDKLTVTGKMAGTAEDGKLSPTVWEGKDGVARASFELTVDKIEFGGKGGNGSSYTPSDDDAPPLSGGEDIKLPF